MLLERYGRECHRATSARFRLPECNVSPYRPEADEEGLRAGRPKPVWPGGAPFAVCLTHDVDTVAAFDLRHHWRRVLNQARFLRHRRDRRAARALGASAAGLFRSLKPFRGVDRTHAHEAWLAMESEVGAKSTFLFLPERYARPHYTDGGYRYADKIRFCGQTCSLAEMMRELHRRGWEVGLHASWNSYDSVDEMKRQKEQVERAVDADVISVRQHHLHFDVRCTAGVQHEAGFLVDSSLGYNDDVGFRHGTCYPWRLRDGSSARVLDVLELPLVIQEKCLVEVLGCGSAELAMAWAGRIVERVESVGGVLTLLWHPGTFSRPACAETYRRLLKSLHEKGAWFGTMGEIGRWWSESRHVSSAADARAPGLAERSWPNPAAAPS
jgi:hypothetical protein